KIVRINRTRRRISRYGQDLLALTVEVLPEFRRAPDELLVGLCRTKGRESPICIVATCLVSMSFNKDGFDGWLTTFLSNLSTRFDLAGHIFSKHFCENSSYRVNVRQRIAFQHPFIALELDGIFCDTQYITIWTYLDPDVSFQQAFLNLR